MSGRRSWLYVAGVLGPFGGGVMNPMVPELREAFGVGTGALAWGFTGYLLPFAVLLLVSGTVAARWGVARTLRIAFVLYVPATLACVWAPTFAWFIAGRVSQGALNAFMTPLLLASLVDAAAPERLGRTVGRYAAFQSLGQLMSPVAGGFAADVDWRLAFVGVAVVSAAVAVMLPPGGAAGAAPPGGAAP
ncbi:MAG TPA: MFS transporter, partial [Acidimicrobiaceae bacterium]|nr:MFS transporter [Acidimicrobiaceae bacterium]